MDFFHSLDYLYGLGHETLTMKFGLRNTQTLLAAFGNPQQSFLKIQIAGTNGKGSVCAFLDGIALAANLRTGLFTSPHLISITERIKIDGREISQTEFAELISQVRTTAEYLINIGSLETLPTFFEQLTVVALLAFRRAEVDVTILETGLGGRLDSTTAAHAEIVGITSISLDHQEYLGETLEKIAAEKAAIIRQNVYAVTVKQKPKVMREILRRSKSVGVTPQIATDNFEIRSETADGKLTATFRTANETYKNVCLNLRGRHQLENAALAIDLARTLREFNFDISNGAIVKGLQTAVHAGRLELWENYKTPILFDGAHNAAGAIALRDFLEKFYYKTSLTMIFGAMRDKDLSEITAALFPLAANLILTRADNPRSASIEDLGNFAAKMRNIYLASNVADALQTARQITRSNELICVTGSLYLIGEAQKILLAENSEIG
jgi:dihydrofolate synthase/folylpolyglutamate synthase